MEVLHDLDSSVAYFKGDLRGSGGGSGVWNRGRRVDGAVGEDVKGMTRRLRRGCNLGGFVGRGLGLGVGSGVRVRWNGSRV